MNLHNKRDLTSRFVKLFSNLEIMHRVFCLFVLFLFLKIFNLFNMWAWPVNKVRKSCLNAFTWIWLFQNVCMYINCFPRCCLQALAILPRITKMLTWTLCKYYANALFSCAVNGNAASHIMVLRKSCRPYCKWDQEYHS